MRKGKSEVRVKGTREKERKKIKKLNVKFQ